MKLITLELIRSWKPCYDPSRHLSEDWKGTAVDLLKIDSIPFNDRLWVVCREELVSEKTIRLFAVWCARQVQHLMTDQRSIDALEVAERYAHGNASREELVAARAAACDAARDAARDTACDAAWDTARAAARAAACDAARDTARAAACDAAWAAARAAARDAAWDAARDAAWAEAISKQRNKLIEMIEAENES